MVTKLQLTKELHDWREKAKGIEDKSSTLFKDVMIAINEVKVKIQYLFGEKNASK